MSHTTPSKTRTIFALLSIMIGYSMALLDTTIVNITLPKMTEFYDTDMQTISWVLNAYNLAFAVLLITASRLADQFGRKKIFLLGVVLFTISSFLCGFSTSVEAMILFRVVQGLAAALLVPVTLPMALLLVSPKQHGMLMGFWGALGGLAAASGPALGGILADHLDWQWIFYINIPAGILTVLVCMRLVKESYDQTATKKIDWGGTITLIVSMFCLTLALLQANDKGWTSAYILTLLVVGVLALIAFFRIESKTSEPMLPLGLFKIQAFTAGSIGMFVLIIGMTAVAFLCSFYLILIAGMSPETAGNTLAFMSLSSMVFAGAAGPLSYKFGSRIFSVAGLVIFGISIYLCGDLTADATRGDVIWRLLVAGAGMGLAMTPMTTASMKAVPEDKYGISSGVSNMTRTLGQVLGLAVLLTIFNQNVTTAMEDAKREVIRLVQTDTKLSPQAQDDFLKKLQSADMSQNAAMPSKEDIAAQMEVAKTKALASVPEAAKAQVAEQFDAQAQETLALLSKSDLVFKGKMTGAFDDTFKSSSWIVILGVIACLFLEPFRRKADAKQQVNA
jgi:EmrB/QacA subfamily drug resistance transporter